MEIHWKYRDVAHAEKISTSGFDWILLDEGDKQFVRENIMEAIYEQAQSKPIQKQYIRSLK